MGESIREKVRKASDRVLGDEWANWQGEGEEAVVAARGLFIIFSMLVTFFMESFTIGVWWLTAPRLAMILPGLDWIVFWSLITGFVVLDIWLLLVFISLLVQRPFGPLTSGAVGLVNHLLPHAVKWGLRFGISRDKMGNSFIKVSNQLAWAVARKIKAYKSVLILLPRCLRPQDRSEVKKLAEKLGQKVFTVSGGEAARQRIKEIMPDLIVAIACERDLMSGIQDVSGRIPVLGVPNSRPNGPCKDTSCDISEVFRIMSAFPVATGQSS